MPYERFSEFKTIFYLKTLIGMGFSVAYIRSNVPQHLRNGAYIAGMIESLSFSFFEGLILLHAERSNVDQNLKDHEIQYIRASGRGAVIWCSVILTQAVMCVIDVALLFCQSREPLSSFYTFELGNISVISAIPSAINCINTYYGLTSYYY